MNIETQVRLLSQLCTRDDAGVHFSSKFSRSDLEQLEQAELITIKRPVHETGIPYSEESWTVAVTDEGDELVAAYPEHWYCKYRIRISDGNAIEYADTLADAANIIGEWYDYLLDNGRISGMPRSDLDESDLDALRRSVRRWEDRIAEAMDYKGFAGHGRYYVSAADQAGLCLSVTAEQAD